jgi:nitrite reductase (NADH) small subunit
MTDWIDIAALDDIPAGGRAAVRTPQGCVAVFRTCDDQGIRAGDRCPHKGGPLSEGIVHGHAVTCPLHNWVFDLETGMALGADEGRGPHLSPQSVDQAGILLAPDMPADERAAE